MDLVELEAWYLSPGHVRNFKTHAACDSISNFCCYLTLAEDGWQARPAAGIAWKAGRRQEPRLKQNSQFFSTCY